MIQSVTQDDTGKYPVSDDRIRAEYAQGLAAQGVPLREACSLYAKMFGGSAFLAITKLAGPYTTLAAQGHEPALVAVLASQYCHDYCSRKQITLPRAFPSELDKPQKMEGTWNASNGYGGPRPKD